MDATSLVRDYEALIQRTRLGPAAALAVPTPEHFLPLLHVAGAAGEEEEVAFFAERVTLGAISMRCVAFGLPPANPEARPGETP